MYIYMRCWYSRTLSRTSLCTPRGWSRQPDKTGGETGVKTDLYLITVEDPGGHTRQHQQEERQELEEGGEDTAGLGVSEVLSGESSLDDHLDPRCVFSQEIYRISQKT